MQIFLGKNKKFSNEFYNLAIRIGNLYSKTDERNLFRNELESLKAYINGNRIIPAYQVEYIVRLVLCHTYLYNINFSKIYSVNLTKSKSLLVKKAGYLSSGLFLTANDEKRLLVIGSLQQDINSSNVIESETALVNIDKLITTDFLSAVVHDIRNLAMGGKGIVPTREAKALNAYYFCYEKDPSSCRDVLELVRAKLDIFKPDSDKDSQSNLNLETALMSIAIINKHLSLSREVGPFSDILPLIVRFLAAAIDRMIPRQLEYHLNPAPWHQQMVLHIISRLANLDPDFPQAMEDLPKTSGLNITLADLFIALIKFHDDGLNLGKGLVIETFNTAFETNCMDNKELNNMAIVSANEFISSNSNMIKLAGLTLISKLGPSMEAFKVLVSFIFNQDEAISKEAFKVAKYITSEDTIKILIDYMLPAIQKAPFKGRAGLVSEFVGICEMYCPDSNYFIEKTLKVILNFTSNLNINFLDKYIKTILEFNETFKDCLESCIKQTEELLNKSFEKENVNLNIIYLYVVLLIYNNQNGENNLGSKIKEYITKHYKKGSSESYLILSLLVTLKDSQKIQELDTIEEDLTFDHLVGDSNEEEVFEPTFLNEEDDSSLRVGTQLNFEAYKSNFVRKERTSSVSYITKLEEKSEDEEDSTNIFAETQNEEKDESKEENKEKGEEILNRLKKGRWKKRIEAKKTLDVFAAQKKSSVSLFAGLSTDKKGPLNLSELSKVKKIEKHKGLELFKELKEDWVLIKVFKGKVSYLEIINKSKEEKEFRIWSEEECVKSLKIEGEENKEDISDMFAMEEEEEEVGVSKEVKVVIDKGKSVFVEIEKDEKEEGGRIVKVEEEDKIVEMDINNKEEETVKQDE